MTPYDAIAMFILALVGLAGAALCAGGEMGAYSVNRVRLALRVRGDGGKPDRAAAVLAAELEQAPRLLATLLIGYNVFSYANSIGTTALLQARGYGEVAIIALNVLVIAPVLFVLADSLPKELFRAQADRLTYAIARPLKWLRLFLTWTLVLPMVQWLARRLAALVHGGDEAAVQSARERIASLIKEGAEDGAISQSQVTMLDRAFALRETTVGDEMVPWAKVHKIVSTTGRANVIEQMAARPVSRFPVIDQRGQVLGVVDFLKVMLEPGKTPVELAAKAVTLNARLPVREALVRLSAAGTGLAIVTADGAATSKPLGIVTAKDLVEPLTGELKAF